jgi:RNA polymerase sigma-70 factor (subfamily 1)
LSSAPEDTIALLERHKAGDPDALDVLLQRYYPHVVRIVGVRMRSQTKARVDIADLVQQTMERAIRSLEHYEQQEDARWINWLACIAERVVLSNYRDQLAACRDLRRESAKVGQGDTTNGLPYVNPTADVDSPSVVVSRQEHHEMLDECLAELEEDQREVILMRDFAGASWEYVAAELKRPSSDAARKFYDRARSALKEKLRLVMGDGA